IDAALRTALSHELASLKRRERAKLAESFESVRRRIPQLRQDGLTRRMQRVCSRLGVKTTDLWPREIGFAKGFPKAAGTRNRLFHAASDLTGESAFGDLVRIQTLTERLILATIRWPEKKLWAWHWQRLDRMNCP